MVVERLKHRTYAGIPANMFFWRICDQQEIDLVEERDGRLFGYEFKWGPKNSPTAPGHWGTSYPTATFSVIHPENYQDFVLSAEKS